MPFQRLPDDCVHTRPPKASKPPKPLSVRYRCLRFGAERQEVIHPFAHALLEIGLGLRARPCACDIGDDRLTDTLDRIVAEHAGVEQFLEQLKRPEERREGKKCVSTGRSRWA